MKGKSESEVQPHGLQPTRLLCPWDFPGKSTGVGCPCLFLDNVLKWHEILLRYSIEFWEDGSEISVVIFPPKASL